MSGKLRDFLTMAAADVYEAMHEREAGPHLGRCTHPACVPVDGGVQLYRCTACFNAPVFCAEHIVAAHAAVPFHVLESWSAEDGCWVRTSLRPLNMALALGHQGLTCPFTQLPAAKKAATSTLTVVSDHGIFPLDITFCQCKHKGRSDNSHALQLIRSGLWPASWKQPRTVYTMAVMEHFRSLSAVAHVNAYDFYKHLASLFDDLPPDETKVSAVSLDERLVLTRIPGSLPRVHPLCS